jgi:hypothetical protein
MRRPSPILVVSLLFMPSVALSQPSSEWTEVVYPVSHLVLPLDAKHPTATCHRKLMDEVLAKVAPNTWDHAGGEATIRYDAKRLTLHVRQTAAGHQELARFLKEIERPQIKVEMRILSSRESIFGNPDDKKWKKQAGMEVALVDDVGLFAMMERAQDDRETHIMQAPTMTICDGDSAGFEIADEVHYVTGFHSVTEAGKTRLEPTAESKRLGVFGKFRPTLSRDGKSIALDLEMSASNVARWKSTPTQVKGVFVKVPEITELKAAASATIPDRRVLLIRGERIECDRVGPSPMEWLPLVGPLLFPGEHDREPVAIVWAVSVEIVREEQPDVWGVGPLRNVIEYNNHADHREDRPRYSWKAR